MAAVVQGDAAQTAGGHGLQAVHVEPGRNWKNWVPNCRFIVVVNGLLIL